MDVLRDKLLVYSDFDDFGCEFNVVDPYFNITDDTSRIPQIIDLSLAAALFAKADHIAEDTRTTIEALQFSGPYPRKGYIVIDLANDMLNIAALDDTHRVIIEMTGVYIGDHVKDARALQKNFKKSASSAKSAEYFFIT